MLEPFLSECLNDDVILQVVPTTEVSHPVRTHPSIFFIKNRKTSKIYNFCVDHPDCISDGLYMVIKTLNKLKGKKWVLDKKSVTQLLCGQLNNLYDINLCEFLTNNKIIEFCEFYTKSHFLITSNASSDYCINRYIPLLKHKESFMDFCEVAEKVINDYNIDNAYLKLNNEFIDTLAKIEENGIYVDINEFSKHFDSNLISGNLVYSQYNIYTSTGRPSNRFGGINYAALNATDGSRKSFISRYGKDGQMVVIDYSAFHPRIICYLVGYSVPVKTDIYGYLSKLYFQKEDVNEYDIAESKKITFRQLYGGVEDKYSHIKYLSHLKDFINMEWEFFKNNGYVLTPFFERKITDKHITDPNPNKLFNYILQASEGEIAIPLLGQVNEYVKDKKTKVVLYTYDAVLYDFHRDDMRILRDIMDIMSDGGKFPIKCYCGESYQDVIQF